jgi:hypothetical protein
MSIDESVQAGSRLSKVRFTQSFLGLLEQDYVGLIDAKFLT